MMAVVAGGVLVFVIAGLVLSGGLWAVGAFSNNYTQSVNGKRGFLICSGVAFAVGALQTMIQYGLDGGDWLVVVAVVDTLVSVFIIWNLRHRVRRTAAARVGADRWALSRWALIVAGVPTVIAVLWWFAGPVAGMLIVLPVVFGVVCFRGRAAGRKVWRTVLWSVLLAGSIFLPRSAREGWLTETWVFYLDTAGPRRYRHLVSALVQLPALVWTIHGMSRRARRSCGPSRPVADWGPVALRVVGMLLRQVSRPMDWVASSYARSCALTTVIMAGVVTGVYLVGGWSRVWDDLEQQLVVLIVVGGALSAWRRLRGIRLKDSGSSPGA